MNKYIAEYFDDGYVRKEKIEADNIEMALRISINRLGNVISIRKQLDDVYFGEL